MATVTKPEVNKSQSIRDYLKKNPTVHPKEVVAGLAEKGITVTESHVYVVKGKLKEKKLQKAKEKKAAASEPAIAKNSTPPAAPITTNKSQAVRDLLRANPSLSVDEVISTLAGSGLTVKKGLIYMVKGKRKPKKRWKAKENTAQEPVATTAAASSTSNNDSAGDALKTIKQIKGLAAELGGIKKLKALVDALAE